MVRRFFRWIDAKDKAKFNRIYGPPPPRPVLKVLGVRVWAIALALGIFFLCWGLWEVSYIAATLGEVYVMPPDADMRASTADDRHGWLRHVSDEHGYGFTLAVAGLFLIVGSWEFRHREFAQRKPR